jgi:hypothetical protein
MGASRSYCTSRVLAEKHRAIASRDRRPLWKRVWKGRLATVMLGVITALSAGASPVTRAETQNASSKNEGQDRPTPPVAPADTPKGDPQVPPIAPADTPKGQNPPPPVAPADIPPGGTPAPDLDAPKRDPAAPSDFQKKARPSGDDAKEEVEGPLLEALSLRYKFVERYSIDENAKPELIKQYRVATRDTSKIVRDRPQSAPEQTDDTLQTIYTERVAQVNRIGLATDTVRRYDKVFSKSAARAPVMTPPYLQGLTILYRRRPKQRPEVLTLQADRTLRGAEYAEISGEVFLPQLEVLLPRTPVRVNDKWEIAPEVAHEVFGELPDVVGYELIGSLLEVSKVAAGKPLTAVIGIRGQFKLPQGQSAFNARLNFTFANPPAPPAAENAKKDDPRSRLARGGADRGIVEARGWITRALMVQVLVRLSDEGNGRLKNTVTRELDVERRLLADAPDASGAQVAALQVPKPLPVADETNSWLLYDDPAGRFHFSHPQELQITGSTANQIDLMNPRPIGGHDVLVIMQKPRGDDSSGANAFRDPAQLRRILEEQWAANKTEATLGPAGWLPPDEWAQFKRKVFRIESAVNPPLSDQGQGKRFYEDDYLVEMTSVPKRSVVFRSFTERDDHVSFRNQVESVIKSFQFGSTEKRATAVQALPSLTPPPTQ